MDIDQVSANGVVGAMSQSAEEIRQLTGKGVVDNRPWIDAVSNLMSVIQSIRQALHGLGRSAVSPGPQKLHVGQP